MSLVMTAHTLALLYVDVGQNGPKLHGDVPHTTFSVDKHVKGPCMRLEGDPPSAMFDSCSSSI
ncbi:uncharacterized protein B0H18DRAFT_1017236 [Fomitopsis serialis]|uniref:uncharacterized protein n=1 Tax=Fomitopsis serialis TaxID=139415 RepID=UPI002007F68D|nr:uncharacterized protein B0H18DRAFT_1017236 [Neoantrodia serialis]KAH9922644.1 hypothetical protein B0H18DRAFT_1017236 [Neoantrodia serialis]